MKYENYIFDLDGTLLDTIEDLAAACNYALRSYGMSEHAVADVRRFVGNGVAKLIERSVPQGDKNAHFKDILRLFRAYYLEHSAVYTRPYDGIPQLLKSLVDNGKGIAVVSNKFDAATKALVQKYFGNTIRVALGESEQIRKKPSPDMVVEAMRLLGATPDNSVYIGDSEVDITTAVNCALPSVSVLWGFKNRAFLVEHGATTLVTKPSDILKL